MHDAGCVQCGLGSGLLPLCHRKFVLEGNGHHNCCRGELRLCLLFCHLRPRINLKRQRGIAPGASDVQRQCRRPCRRATWLWPARPHGMLPHQAHHVAVQLVDCQLLLAFGRAARLAGCSSPKRCQRGRLRAGLLGSPLAAAKPAHAAQQVGSTGMRRRNRLGRLGHRCRRCRLRGRCCRRQLLACGCHSTSNCCEACEGKTTASVSCQLPGGFKSMLLRPAKPRPQRSRPARRCTACCTADAAVPCWRLPGMGGMGGCCPCWLDPLALGWAVIQRGLPRRRICCSCPNVPVLQRCGTPWPPSCCARCRRLLTLRRAAGQRRHAPPHAPPLQLPAAAALGALKAVYVVKCVALRRES